VSTTVKPAIVLVGAKSPTTLTCTVFQGDSALDMTTVTAVTLDVQRPDGSQSNWTATIQSVLPPSAPGGSMLVCTYAFNGNGLDCLVLGQYQVHPILTTPGGPADAYAQPLYVVSKYNTN
jgi:hypothetical protein